MYIPKPNWSDLEGRWWIDWVKGLPYDYEGRRRWVEQINNAAKANKELADKCVVSARVRAGQDEFSITPGRDFYKDHPVCYGYGQWTKSSNNFETAKEAKDIIITLSPAIPNIDVIDLGRRGARSAETVKKCNKWWHHAIQEEVSEGILVDEGMAAECTRRPTEEPISI
jgi:hypothetical protein